MKTASDELFRLIQAMTRAEKRYFRLYAQRHVQSGETNYLQLYDAIAVMAHYDEEALKETVKNEKFAEYLPAAKYYLHNLLLDSLHAFHEGREGASCMRRRLHHAELLHEKGLTESSRKVLKRVKKQATASENFGLLLEVLALEKRILARKYYRDIKEEALDALYEEENDLLNKVVNLNEYWYLHGRLYHHHFTKGLTADAQQREVLDTIREHPLLESPEHTLSFRAQMDYWQTKAISAFAEGDTQEAYKGNAQFLHLMESEPERLAEYPKRYMASLNNFLIDSLNLKKYGELETGLKKLRNLPEQPGFKTIQNLDADIFRLSSILELNASINQGRFMEAYDLLPEVEQGLEKFQSRIVKHNVVTLWYLSAYVCFGAGQPKEGLQWCNRIINDTDTELVEDIYAAARILSLVIHFDLGNFDLLEYMRKTTLRYLQSKGRLFELEKLFLDFLRKQEAAFDRQAQKTLLKQLRTCLLPLRDSRKEGRAFAYFDFVAWIDSHLQNKPFAEVVAGA